MQRRGIMVCMKSSQEVTIALRRLQLPGLHIGIGVLALIIVGAVIGLLAREDVPSAQGDEPTLLPPPPAVDPEAIFTLLPRDSIMAIDDPQYATVAEAAEFLEPEEQIIGVLINGEARAYPLPIMSSHEIVNDVIGGEPVAVTWCPLCFSALVFSREVVGQDEPLTFGVSGKLLNETLVMYDRQTDTLWSQLYGAAVDGPLTGDRLSFFPSALTEWTSWREQYPDSLVLSKPLTCIQFDCGTYATNPRGSYDVDPYAGYYNSADEGVVYRSIPRDDERASGRPKRRVLGLRLAGIERAYPYSVLAQQPLVNDSINGLPVLVWFDAETLTGVAYRRDLDGRTLTFSQASDKPATLIDEQTGSQWSTLTGQASSGPLQGRRLAPLVATPAFAFGWFGYFPNSEIYGGA